MTQLRGITEEASRHLCSQSCSLQAAGCRLGAGLLVAVKDIALARTDHDRESRMARVAILEQISVESLHELADAYCSSRTTMADSVPSVPRSSS